MGIKDAIEKITRKPETKKESLDSFSSKLNPINSAYIEGRLRLFFM